MHSPNCSVMGLIIPIILNMGLEWKIEQFHHCLTSNAEVVPRKYFINYRGTRNEGTK